MIHLSYTSKLVKIVKLPVYFNVQGENTFKRINLTEFLKLSILFIANLHYLKINFFDKIFENNCCMPLSSEAFATGTVTRGTFCRIN